MHDSSLRDADRYTYTVCIHDRGTIVPKGVRTEKHRYDQRNETFEISNIKDREASEYAEKKEARGNKNYNFIQVKKF